MGHIPDIMNHRGRCFIPPVHSSSDPSRKGGLLTVGNAENVLAICEGNFMSTPAFRLLFL